MIPRSQTLCECLPMSAPYESTKDRKWTQNTNLQKTGNGHKMNFLSHFACWYEYFLYLCKSNDGYGNNEYYFKI